MLEVRLRGGLKLNIELKNSIVPYAGMEAKMIGLVHSRGLQNSIVYSSFSAMSVERVRAIDPQAETGILDNKASDCLYKLKGGCGANALHPNWNAIDLPPEALSGYTVRAWSGGRLFPEKPTGRRMELAPLEERGITDVFLNEPERYLSDNDICA